MNQIDYLKLFQVSVLLCELKGIKTIDTKIIQYAFKILYMGTPLFKTAQSNATKYVSYYACTEGCAVSEFKKAIKLKKSLKKFLDTAGQDIFICEYRISNAVGIYLCGLDDVFDNSYESQYKNLGKKIDKTIKSKKQEPIPEDLIEEEEEEELTLEEVEVDEEDIELIIPVKTRSKTKSANV